VWSPSGIRGRLGSAKQQALPLRSNSPRLIEIALIAKSKRQSSRGEK
jgi:hypothetical protein